MRTRKIKKNSKNNKNNKNSKKINPSIKKINSGYSIYKAYKFDGKELLHYTKFLEKESGDSCLFENISWFSDLEVAKQYKTSDTNIYKWNIKIPTNLLNITHDNINFIDNLFLTTNKILNPFLDLNKNITYEHPYLNMTNNEKALYEFKFVFGYITLKEQYRFLLFIKYLIENNYVKIEKRNGDSIINKVRLKILYYNSYQFINKKERFNRLSIYKFDKYAVMNLCKCLKYKYNISGIYQKNDTSFWFPSLLFYKMNIKEYIFFDPWKNLKYDKNYIY